MNIFFFELFLKHNFVYTKSRITSSYQEIYKLCEDCRTLYLATLSCK